MFFTRNLTGVSHAPAEHVEDDDAEAEAGAVALGAVLADLLDQP
jgi:N-carbamoyl-L-amino-acid hydrolase